jgi:signal transduction histidine kinase
MQAARQLRPMIWPFWLSILLLGLSGVLMVEVLSACRAYIAGESIWSKAEKRAVLDLVRYVETGSEDELARFREDIDIIYGDRKARLALSQTKPDFARARAGFIQGGNHPDDVNGLIFVFVAGRRLPLIDRAIQLWSLGDNSIDQMVQLADEIQGKVRAGQSREQLRPALVRLYQIDATLSALEHEFSLAISQQTRQITLLLIGVVLPVSGLLLIFAATFISYKVMVKKVVAEAAVRELNSGLERRVLERTAQLAEANAQLESFTYSVSHDLRAPLRAIQGYSRMLEEDHQAGLDAEGRRLLETIIDNTRKMSQLIDDLLTFSRLGQQSFWPTEVDMTALAAETVTALSAAGGDRAQVTVDPLPAVHGDRGMLRQVWVNLLSNATKYSSTRSAPRIEVTGHTNAAEHIYCVKDNGVGFDMEYYDKLFGVFQRLHSASEFPGTGVGLAIVQRIVARHGGRVWAESRVNEGAAFYFSLPTGDKLGAPQKH